MGPSVYVAVRGDGHFRHWVNLGLADRRFLFLSIIWSSCFLAVEIWQQDHARAVDQGQGGQLVVGVRQGLILLIHADQTPFG